MSWLWVAAGIARVVVAPDTAPPDMEPDDAILFVQHANTCVPDAGIDYDAGSPALDAMGPTPPPPEAAIPDAGPPDDGGIPDAGTTDCGNSVMMVVQPRFSLSPSGSTFALLYVTPAAPVMRLEASSTFDDLAAATAPAIETQIVEVPDPTLGTVCEGCGAGNTSNSGGCNYESNPSWTPPSLDGGVGGSTIDTVGPYDVATRQPASRADLAGWLDELGYRYDTSDLDALDPYVAQGWSVVAVRISEHSAFTGGLAPLSMTWAGSDIVVPLRLASQSALTVYISADHRYDLPDAHVSYAAFAGPSFITRNEVTDLSYDRTAERAAVDEYERDVKTVYQEEDVPVSKNCDDEGCCQSGPGTTNGALWGVALLMVVGRPRRSARRRR
jgi:hypothetical protein